MFKMKSVLIFSLCLLCMSAITSISLSANWKKIEELSKKNIPLYIDLETLMIYGDSNTPKIVDFWLMDEFNQENTIVKFMNHYIANCTVFEAKHTEKIGYKNNRPIDIKHTPKKYSKQELQDSTLGKVVTALCYPSKSAIKIK